MTPFQPLARLHVCLIDVVLSNHGTQAKMACACQLNRVFISILRVLNDHAPHKSLYEIMFDVDAFHVELGENGPCRGNCVVGGNIQSDERVLVLVQRDSKKCKPKLGADVSTTGGLLIKHPRLYQVFLATRAVFIEKS
jgi:hypothetical protein